MQQKFAKAVQQISNSSKQGLAKVMEQNSIEQEKIQHCLKDQLRRSQQDDEMASKSELILNAKRQQLVQKNLAMESVLTGMKETVSKVKPQLLHKMKVESGAVEERVFREIFSVIYQEPEEQFEWQFCKKILDKNGEDFKSRMACVNLRGGLNEREERTVLKMRNDKEFESKAQEEPLMLDFLDYIDYMAKGIEIWNERNNVDSEIKKISNRLKFGSKDSSKRGVAFWKEAQRISRQAEESFRNVRGILNAYEIKLNNMVKAI